MTSGDLRTGGARFSERHGAGVWAATGFGFVTLMGFVLR